MKLKRIFIHGFKSFANPTTLDISDGITAIVGPNGSGKSNILDAIRWLFGEQSLKSLRADEKYDLIFSGSEKYPPARKAYVELTFENEGETIVVARELTRDGKNVFYINGRQARLKDIRDLFTGTGVGKDFYSVIAQGQVDKIVTSSSKELRNLFEEAAGTAVYREKKRETLQKLQSVESNLSTLSSILIEKGKMVHSLYLKAKRAERYKEYSQRLEEVKKLFYGNLLLREKEKKEVLEGELRKNEEKLREIRRKLVEIEGSWNALKSKAEEMDERIKAFTKMLEEYDKRRKQLSDLKSVYSRRLSDLEGRYIEKTTKLSSLSEDREKLLKRKEELSVIIKGLKEEFSKKEKEVKQLEMERDEIASKLSEKEREALKTRDEISRIEKEILKLEGEREKLRSSIEDFISRTKLVSKQLSQKKERLEQLSEEISSMMETLQKTGQREKELLGELDEVKKRMGEIAEEEKEFLSEMNEILSTKNRLQAERNEIKRQMESYEGYSRAIKEIFARRENFEGLHDVVGNILEVEEEHEKAIAALLGGSVQNIVVENAEVAKEIIEFLREMDFGRATFLPLDMIEGSFTSIPQVESHPGFVGYAVELVRVPKGFEKLPSYLFGSDIVVKTLDDAVDLKRKYKLRVRMATLEGDLISARGAISGGSVRKEDPLLGRKIRLRKLDDEISKLSEREEELRRKLDDITQEKESLRRQEDIIRMELAEIAARSRSTKRVLEELVRSSKELEDEVRSLEKLMKDYQSRISGMEARIERIESEIKTRRENLRSLEEKMGEFSQELGELKDKLNEIGERLVEKTLELGEIREKLSSYEREREEVAGKLSEMENLESELKAQVRDLEREISSVRSMLEDTEREMRTLEKEYQELFGSVSTHHEDKGRILEELRKVEEELEGLKEERERLKDLMHSLELDLQSTIAKISRYEEELGGGVDDVERLSDDDLEQLETEMRDLQTKIKYLGPVDLGAIDEYERLSQEYKELQEKKEDLEHAKKKLLAIMEETEREARRKFMEIFKLVNENFNRYISELFFGGEGKIRMAGDDVFEADLEITIRKPGKRSQKLQLLSGGEKALVAIALLFSFLQVNPSPFYVLDEVDGPLDDYNAERFAMFLKNFSKDSQFLVITHNKIVMEAADVLHGITMVDGTSVVIPVELTETR